MADRVLDTDERNKLVAVLCTIPDFASDVQGRKAFVQAAGLGRFVHQVVWAGSDQVVAGSLVDALNTHGFLRRVPGDPASTTPYHAVGKLLAYLLDYPGVGTEDAAFLATLVVRHGLVRDPIYIESLRSEYGITAQPPAEVGQPAAVLAPKLIVPLPQPAFAPLVQDALALERVLNSEDNFLDVYGLLNAFYCAQAVGRVEAPENQALGTGWLIAPDLLLTNAHVLPNKDWVAEAVVRFGYMSDAAGVKLTGDRPIKLDPDFHFASPEQQLDYALVRLQETPLKAKMVADGIESLSILDLIRQDKHRGYLVATPRNILNLQRVNIIQHPAGDPLKVVLTQNYVTADAQNRRVHYRADTKKGSSGSPVFNMLWEVIALHHAGEAYPPDSAGSSEKGEGHFGINEGIPMKDILEDLRDRKDDKGFRLIGYVPSPK